MPISKISSDIICNIEADYPANYTQIMLFVDSRLLLPIGAGSRWKPKIQLY